MTNTTNRVTRKAMVFGYLDQSSETRLPLKKFLKANKMIRQTFYKFEGEYKVEKASLTKREKGEHEEQLRATVEDAWDRVEGRDPQERKSQKATQEWLKSKGHEINEALVKACKSNNAQALKLFFQLTEQLVEKQEVKIGLSADEITRRNLEAERQLREGGYRVEEV